MKNSVSERSFDPRAVPGYATGAIDGFDYVDAYQGLVPHPRPTRVPRGAPLEVRGWVLDPLEPGPVNAVRLTIDGALGYDAVVAGDRFRARVPTDVLAPGGHELRAYAGAEERANEVARVAFWVYGAPPDARSARAATVRLRLDTVVTLSPAGAVVRVGAPVPCGEHALVLGWAIDLQTRRGLSGAVATDRRGRRWNAPCDVARPDLRVPLDAADERLGFEIVIPTAALGRGRHELTVTAYDDDGTIASSAERIALDVTGRIARFPSFAREDPAPPRIDALVPRKPVPAGEIVEVEGWALDPSGGGAGEVFIELRTPDVPVAVHRFSALAGYRRDDGVSALAVPPCDDAWFRCALDTAQIGCRRYDVVAVVVAADRASYSSRALGTLDVVRPVRSVTNAQREDR